VSGPRRPLEFADPPGEDVVDELARLVRQRARDQGRVLASFRCWPGPGAWVVMGLLLLPLLVLCATAPDRTELLVRGTAAAGLLGWLAVFTAVGALDVHRVCEHGLVLGHRRTSRYVVPWASVDPGRVRVVRSTLLVGRHREVPTVSPVYRVGLFTTTTSLAVNGFDSTGGATPFTWWVLGTPRARRLAAAVEAAMVADGYPAHGLAERAHRQAVRAHWRRPAAHPLAARALSDPVVGVDGPLLPSGW